MKMEVNILEKSKNLKKNKEQLPLAVFICPKLKIEELDDYKQIFTHIILDRIKEKY